MPRDRIKKGDKMMAKQNKYNNNRSAGYDSNAEKEYGDVLELLRIADPPEIISYQHHPPAVVLVGSVKWRIDFFVETEKHKFFIEVKGLATSDYKIKLELYRSLYPQGNLLPLFIVKKYGPHRFMVIDEIGTEGINTPVIWS